MYSNEQPEGQDVHRRHVASPLEWLANLPVIPPRHRTKVRMVGLLLGAVLLMYWLVPRWGVSPFHSRQDGLDYYPYFTDVQSPRFQSSAPARMPDTVVAVGWPGWRLEQYAKRDGEANGWLVLRNADGSVRWQQVADNGNWLGDYRLKPGSAHWAWFGGWVVELQSPQVDAARLYLAPDGSPRLIRQWPNAQARATLKALGA
ncbi:hypothetical protein [Jeongeupia chitinilytica]|uniref:Uncharacterized protein n=1 Tax=Jeongeupia chitinilytica TaxID=1041641 RepID=A0ABQ3H262_9NEIS|nr:hypothetical protein [Jeongeupia chitinilytica]GHD62008.1 hypothetical protein GCM10007350_17270 [Jeongeupia chitinilytica]